MWSLISVAVSFFCVSFSDRNGVPPTGAAALELGIQFKSYTPAAPSE
jgi:hypothetical protein